MRLEKNANSISDTARKVWVDLENVSVVEILGFGRPTAAPGNSFAIDVRLLLLTSSILNPIANTTCQERNKPGSQMLYSQMGSKQQIGTQRSLALVLLKTIGRGRNVLAHLKLFGRGRLPEVKGVEFLVRDARDRRRRLSREDPGEEHWHHHRLGTAHRYSMTHLDNVSVVCRNRKVHRH